MLRLCSWDYFYSCMQNSYLCTLGMDNWKGEVAGGQFFSILFLSISTCEQRPFELRR